jgi:hypothetical protein
MAKKGGQFIKLGKNEGSTKRPWQPKRPLPVSKENPTPEKTGSAKS